MYPNSTHPHPMGLPGSRAPARALRQLRRDWPDSRHIFVTERGAPFTRSGFAKMLSAPAQRLGWRSRCTCTCFGTLAGTTVRRLLARK